MEEEIRNSDGAGRTGPIDVSNLPAETFEVFKTVRRFLDAMQGELDMLPSATDANRTQYCP